MNSFSRFVLVSAAYCISQVGWLAIGQRGIPEALCPGEKTVHLPPCCPMVKTIPMMIVDAAMRNGISPTRALNRAWNETKYQDIPSRCCRGVFQLHRRYWPAMTTSQGIESGVRFLAGKIRIYGRDAEHAYQFGNVRSKQWEALEY